MPVDPDRLDDAASKNESAAGEFERKSDLIASTTHSLGQRVDILGMYWEGVAQSRFFEDWEEEKRKTRKYTDLLEDIAANLRHIADTLRFRAEEERERRRAEEERRRREEEERRRREEEERQRSEETDSGG